MGKGSNERKNILTGVVAMGIATVVVKILSVLYKIPMLNTLGEEGMGYFNTAYTIYSFFFIVCTAGVPKAVMILLSRAREKGDNGEYNKILKVAFYLFLIIGTVGCILFLFFAGLISNAIGSQSSVYSMLMIAPSLVIVAVTGVLRGYLSSVGRLGSISVSQILEGTLKLCIGLVLSRYSLNIGLSTPLCAAMAIVGVDAGALVAMIYMLIVYKKENKGYKSRQKLKINDFKLHTKSIFSISIPITVTSAVMSVSSIIDLFMIISRLKSIGYSEQLCTGLYGNYTTLVVPMFNFCIALISPLAIAYLPKLASSFARGDEGKYSEALSSFSQITMFSASFLYAPLAYFPKQVLYFIFGENGYEVGAEMLSGLAVSVLSYSLLIVVNTSLEARGYVRAPLLSMAIGCAVKIPVEFLLLSMPELNIMGAVYSTNITYIIALAVSLCYALRTRAYKVRFAMDAARCIVASILSSSLVIGVYSLLHCRAESRLHTLILIPVLLLIYLVISLLSLVLRYVFKRNRQFAQKSA
jgi:stage V sporulation protein B